MKLLEKVNNKFGVVTSRTKIGKRDLQVELNL